MCVYVCEREREREIRVKTVRLVLAKVIMYLSQKFASNLRHLIREPRGLNLTAIDVEVLVVQELLVCKEEEQCQLM